MIAIGLCAFAVAALSTLATSTALHTTIEDIESRAAALSDAAQRAVHRVHADAPNFAEAPLDGLVDGWVTAVEDAVAFLLFIRGTEDKVPVEHTALRRALAFVGHLCRVVAVALAICACALALLPVLLLVLVGDVVAGVDALLVGTGVRRPPRQSEQPCRCKRVS